MTTPTHRHLWLLLALAACEATGGESSLLSAHEGGVHGQAGLEGAPAPEAAAEEPLPAVPPPNSEPTPEAPSAEPPMPSPPESDADALAVLEQLPEATPAPQGEPTPGVESWTGSSPSPTPSSAPLPLAAAPCSGAADLASISLSDLSLVQTWPEGATLRAALQSKDGRAFVVERGSVIGPTGAKVVRVVPGEVALAEVQFDIQGNAVLVQQAIRPPLPR